MQPKWIIDPLTPADIAAINQGGCASGAYMPAVTYHEALLTMLKHGDEVFDYLHDIFGETPQAPRASAGSWSAMAVYYLSLAVECWCQAHEHLADWNDDNPIEGD